MLVFYSTGKNEAESHDYTSVYNLVPAMREIPAHSLAFTALSVTRDGAQIGLST